MRKILIYIIYGNEQSYYNSAKFSILTFLNYTQPNDSINIVVLTEKPEEFEGYPITILPISTKQKDNWSLNGKYHFRIKNRGLAYVMDKMNLSDNDRILFLDSDIYFTKTPLVLFNLITDKHVVMYKNEGRIHKKRRFDYYYTNLKGKCIYYKKNNSYTLNIDSEMWGSAIIGITKLARHSIESADCLMLAFLKEVNVDKAHTIEQFSLAEILREKFKIIEGKKYISIFSTSGRKIYAENIINNFLQKNKELPIKLLSKESSTINVERPILRIIKDKFSW